MAQHTSLTHRTLTSPAIRGDTLAAALDLVTDGVLLLGPNLAILSANTRAAELLGRPLLCGACLTEVLSPPSAARLRATAQLFASASATKVTLQLEAAEGSATSFELALHASPVGEPEMTIAILRPARGAADSSLDPNAAERDFLTGLPTRASLAARLQEAEARARSNGSQYAILFIDLDAFKQLNDELGHIAGDCVLSIAAQRLQAAVRPSDLVVRYGGDEFVIVVEEISPQQLARLARRLRTTLAAPLEVTGQWIGITASVGRAFGDAIRSAAQVLDEADRAMYRAKSAKRKKRPR